MSDQERRAAGWDPDLAQRVASGELADRRGEERRPAPAVPLEELAQRRRELSYYAGQAGDHAGELMNGAVLADPARAGISWSTRTLPDGRFCQVVIYLGRAMPPKDRDQVPRESVQRAPDFDLPHIEPQGELAL